MKKQKIIESEGLAWTLVIILLVLILAAVTLVPVSAAELTTDGASASTVAHSVNAEFTASIPAYVMPGEPGEVSADYTVTLENAVIPDNHELTAKVEYSGSMSEQNGVELPYELLDESGVRIASGSKILTKAAGTPDESVSVSFGAALTAKARYAGVYTDTATFTFDVAEKVYTPDEINADEHLFAIGKTKPEYVVAEFNEDYSAVTIFKNGNNSDGEMREWSYNEKSPFTEKKRTLKEATIKVGVTNISSYAFYGYDPTFLTRITIPNSVKSIGDYAFDGCLSLTSVVIPGSVMSIGNSAFFSCTSLESVTIGNGVTNIGSSVFQNCTSLTSIIIPDSVTSVGDYAFADCYSLESVTIGNGVTNTGDSVFRGCKALTSVKISDSVTIIGAEAFAGCTSLTSVKIPDSVTSIYAGAFRSCTSLASVMIGNGVTIIGEAAFDKCTALTSITIPDSVTSICAGAFRSCTALQNIIVSAGNKNYCDIDGVLFNKNATELICCPAGKSGNYTIPDRVTRIESSAFYGCSSLTNITIPNSVKYIIYNAFYDCTLLESITIPDSVTKIYGNVFKGSGLKTIYGVSGSHAETFAAQNGYTFIAQ